MNQNETYQKANTFVLISEFPDYDYFPPAILGVFDDYDLASLFYHYYEMCFYWIQMQSYLQKEMRDIPDDRDIMPVWMYLVLNITVGADPELTIVPMRLNEESVSLVLHPFLRLQEKEN